jgi:hypothetical protein
MPYIPQDSRKPYDDALENCPVNITTPVGHLNYYLTKIILGYLGNANYQKFVEVEGVLHHISHEIYRRRTAAYEDDKARLNSDVF